MLILKSVVLFVVFFVNSLTICSTFQLCLYNFGNSVSLFLCCFGVTALPRQCYLYDCSCHCFEAYCFGGSGQQIFSLAGASNDCRKLAVSGVRNWSTEVTSVAYWCMQCLSI